MELCGVPLLRKRNSHTLILFLVYYDVAQFLEQLDIIMHV